MVCALSLSDPGPAITWSIYALISACATQFAVFETGAVTEPASVSFLELSEEPLELSAVID